MTLRPVLANALADLEVGELANHERPDRKRYAQRGQRTHHGAERDVLENRKYTKVFGQEFRETEEALSGPYVHGRLRKAQVAVRDALSRNILEVFVALARYQYDIPGCGPLNGQPHRRGPFCFHGMDSARRKTGDDVGDDRVWIFRSGIVRG